MPQATRARIVMRITARPPESSRIMSIARITTVAVLAIGTLLATGVAAPAFARPEPAPAAPSVQSHRIGECPLTRVGTQFTRCDDLTGAGVAAPRWIPEQ